MRITLRTCRATGRHGQTIVLFALMSLVLMAGMGLVIDAGVDYANRRIMQSAADTAALTGARAVSRQSAGQPQVLSAVSDIAVRNGVLNASLVVCKYIDNSRQLLQPGLAADVSDCANHTAANPIPPTASGVRVRVRETHGTFAMRAIGIATSGTAASSLALVQLVKLMPTADVPFMVCGVASPNGDSLSILMTQEVTDTSKPQPSPPAAPITKTVVDEDARIKDSAYAYDWNRRTASGDLTVLASPGPAPYFTLSSPSLPNNRKCGMETKAPGWRGLVNQTTNRLNTEATRNGNILRADYLYGQDGTLTNETPANKASCDDGKNLPTCVAIGPGHTINGTQGCKVGENPDGCVLILPIVDNDASNDSDPDGYFFLVRLWGAFQVTKVGDEYRGFLIKNYPIHADGENKWSPAYPSAAFPYRGPLSVTLVK